MVVLNQFLNYKVLIKQIKTHLQRPKIFLHLILLRIMQILSLITFIEEVQYLFNYPVLSGHGISRFVRIIRNSG